MKEPAPSRSPSPTSRPGPLVGIGEVLWDCFPGDRRPGGAPANVAWHASQLGIPGCLVSRVGRDDAGRSLCRTLADQGLDLRFVQVDEELPTGSVDVDLTELEAPRYTILEPAAWDALDMDEDLWALAAQASAVCYGTLFQRSRRSRESLHAFLAAADGAFRLYDVNLRQDYFDRAWIEVSLHAAHAVKMNELEVVHIATILGLAPETPWALADHLRTHYGVAVTCVTRGERGCVLIEGGKIAEVDGHPISVADPVGAGDAFSAAFLVARLSGVPLEETARFANAAGALVTSRPGAMPSLHAEYARLRARLFAREGEAAQAAGRPEPRKSGRAR